MTTGRNQALGVRRVRAGEGADGQRLDNFLLRELSGVPRSRVYRLLRKGEVRVNGKRKQADYRLSADDEVRLPPVRDLPAAEAGPRRVPDALLASVRDSIIHEDARVLVLDKPAGLAVHGGSGLSFGVIEVAARPAARGVPRTRAPARPRHERVPPGRAHSRGAAEPSCPAARGRGRKALRHAACRPLAARPQDDRRASAYEHAAGRRAGGARASRPAKLP